MPLSVHSLPVGKWKVNCYILYDDQNQAIIIDPGGNFDEISLFIKTQSIVPLFIVNTHAHYDHIGAVSQLASYYSLPFYLHSADAKLLKYANLYRKIFDGDDPIDIPEITSYLDHFNNPLALGDIPIKILHTPGHTPGSVCLQIEDNLFSGDTLFHNHIGRVDLPGGNKSVLKDSLIMLCKVQRDLIIYPGHGKTTTLHTEIENNQELLEIIK